MFKNSLIKSTASAAAMALSMLTGGAAMAQANLEDLLSKPVNNPEQISNKPGEVTKVTLYNKKTEQQTVSPATSMRDCFNQVQAATKANQAETSGSCSGPAEYDKNTTRTKAAYRCKLDAQNKTVTVCRVEATL